MILNSFKVLAEEKEMEAIAAPEPSPTKKSANGVGVKSTATEKVLAAANGTNGASADGDKKGITGRGIFASNSYRVIHLP